ncbi:MAG: 16S rRNA (guanine(527)-N(7))-methyltransferase RsmG [Thermoanaerobaculia bacterium]
MGSALPELSFDAFSERLRRCSPRPLSPASEQALHRHYQELRRWNRRLSLVGPGAAPEIVERHYGESLASLPWVAAGSRLLDVGSGAGFPGFVLAAAEPSLEVVLVEARQRKWAFLEAARRAARLSCVCLNATVGDASRAALPAVVDVITVRALKLPPRVLAGLALRLAPTGCLLFWSGEIDPVLPDSLDIAERRPLTGVHRQLLRVVPVVTTVST